MKIGEIAHSSYLWNEFLIFQIWKSNSLVIFNRNTYERVKIFQGIRENDDPIDNKVEWITSLRKVKQPQEYHSQILWHRGEGNFNIIDMLQNFNPTRLDYFLLKEDSEVSFELVMAMYITRPYKVIALCKSPQKEFWLKTYEITKNKSKWFVCKEISDERKTKTIESSLL